MAARACETGRDKEKTEKQKYNEKRRTEKISNSDKDKRLEVKVRGGSAMYTIFKAASLTELYQL